MFEVGQLVKISDDIASHIEEYAIPPKGRFMGGCIGRVSETSDEYQSAVLSIKGGEIWIPYALLSITDESLASFSCYERFHHSPLAAEGEEKLLANIDGNLETAKFVVEALLICTEDSEGVVRDGEGKVICVKSPKGAWQFV